MNIECLIVRIDREGGYMRSSYLYSLYRCNLDGLVGCGLKLVVPTESCCDWILIIFLINGND